VNSTPHIPLTPPPAELPDPPASRPPASTDANALTTVRARITEGLHVPGSRLTLTGLQRATGHPAAALRPALGQLAAEGLVKGPVKGRWWVLDDRPADHGVHRIRNLLKSMIDHGAYPPGTTLPTRAHLAPKLLTTMTALLSASKLLADEGVIHLSGNARPRVAHSSSSGPWPEGAAEALQALRQHPGTGASLGRANIQAIRAAARERWKSGVCLPAEVMAEQELRQEGIVRHLVLTAYQRCADPVDEYPRMRSAAARVMACAALPTDGLPHERLLRFTVLAVALADLSNELASCAAPYRRQAGA